MVGLLGDFGLRYDGSRCALSRLGCDGRSLGALLGPFGFDARDLGIFDFGGDA
jgi:hypothetical protein